MASYETKDSFKYIFIHSKKNLMNEWISQMKDQLYLYFASMSNGLGVRGAE